MIKSLLPVIALAILVSFFNLGSIPLFDVDEAVFSEATKEMVQSGNWTTPTYNDINRYDKPILFYWLMAVSYKIFGINEFAARFPSAIAALLLSLGIFFFVRYFSNNKTALYSSLTLTLSIYFFVYSHAAVTDMALALFTTISLFSFYLSTENDSPGKMKNIYIYGFYFFSALAFLTKGLVGIVFPFGIAITYSLINTGLRGIKDVFNVKGIFVFLIISLPWYIAQLIVNGQEFIQEFLIKHHFKRYTGVISGHRGPIYYYILTLAIGLFPWIAFLPSGIKNAFYKSEELQTQKNDLNISLLKFCLVWFAFIFVFFTFSTTKLPNYILPAIAPVCILIASGMTDQNKKWHLYSNSAIAFISLLITIALLISKKYLLKYGISDTSWIFALSLATAGITIFSFYSALTRKPLYKFIFSLTLVSLFIFSIKALPIAGQYQQGTLHRYSLLAKTKLSDNEKIITYRINNPSILFYSDRRILSLSSKDDLLPYTKTDRNLIAISKTKDIAVLKDLGFAVLEDDGRYAILERK